MSAILTKDVFLENLLKIEQLGCCTSDRVFEEADRQVASALLWWYRQHPEALEENMRDLSALPWHALKALGHLIFSQEKEIIARRRKYRKAFAERVWEPWEIGNKESGLFDKNLWECAFHWAMSIMHEIESKEETEGDILQEFFNFQILNETVSPLPKNNPYAFPAREFNDLVWMDWRAREVFRSEKVKMLFPDQNGVMTISVCEQKIPESEMTRLFIARREYPDLGDIVAAFSGFDSNPVGDLTGMGWVKGMQEKTIPVLALIAFFTDVFRPENYEISLR